MTADSNLPEFYTEPHEQGLAVITIYERPPAYTAAKPKKVAKVYGNGILPLAQKRAALFLAAPEMQRLIHNLLDEIDTGNITNETLTELRKTILASEGLNF